MKKSPDIIDGSISIFSALQLMDEIKKKVLFITDSKGKFKGVLSLGDIQRAIIRQISLQDPVSSIVREHITIARAEDSFEDIKRVMLEMRAEAMPVIDQQGDLVKVVYWADIVDSGEDHHVKRSLDAPVVIMAGGMGTRLRPLTHVIPKPLIPIGEKTILEDIMDSFILFGCNKFYLTVNYLQDMIRYYLNNQSEIKYDVEYLVEDKPLGTAGSIHLLDGRIDQTFFVTNCDIMIDQDYAEILDYHRSNKNELTVVAAIKSFNIPYGTIETRENSILERITEKPEVNFKINTGFYVLEPHLIEEIPKDTFFHITHLIGKLVDEKRRVGVFPVSEGSWRDIGEWSEYFKLIRR